MTDQPEPLRLDFHLLDRQIVDVDGRMVGNVDDVELDVDRGGTPRVVALLVGQAVLGRRIGGLVGRWLEASARRLSPDPDPAPIRIPYDLVVSVGSEIELRVKASALGEPPLETWLRKHVVDRIPGADHAGE